MEQLDLAAFVDSVDADPSRTEARRARFRKRNAKAHVMDAEKAVRKAELAAEAVEAAKRIDDQLSLVFDLVKKRRGRPVGAKTEKPGNDYAWTDEDVLLVMDGLLHQSKKALDPDTSQKERDTILSWIAEPLDADSRNPFSFHACCKAFGLDAEWLQTALLQKAEELETLRGCESA